MEEAVERFEAAAVDAEGRVRAGEPRYQPAANSARSEGATLRANLGVLHVRLVGMQPGVPPAEVEVDTLRHAVRPDGTADVVHRPGDVGFHVVFADGSRSDGSATLVAGRWTSVDVAVPAARRSSSSALTLPAPRDSSAKSPRWLVPVAIGAGAVGVVGMGCLRFLGCGRSRRSTLYTSAVHRTAAHRIATTRVARADDRERVVGRWSRGAGCKHHARRPRAFGGLSLERRTHPADFERIVLVSGSDRGRL